MAAQTAIAEPSKPDPVIRIAWPKDAKGGEIKLSGAGDGALTMGARVRVVVEGTVVGYSMGEYGCSVELKGKAVKVETLGGSEGAEPMTDKLEKHRARRGKAGY